MKVEVFSPTATVRQAGKPDRSDGESQRLVAETRPSEGPVMARTVRLLLTTVMLGAALPMPAARAQALAQPPASTAPAADPLASTVQAAATPTTTTGAPAAPVSTTGAPAARPDAATVIGELPAALPESATALSDWQPEFLKSLPQPPDQPASLFQAAPPPGPPPPDLERYFEVDPILDTPLLGQKPGWFSSVQIAAIQPHLQYGQMRLINSLKVPSGHRVIVAPGAARLNWTAAPRIEIGYWLPSGFGGLAFSDRFFNAAGSGPFSGPAGTTSRSTTLGLNYSDWDYISREFTPWDSERGFWNLEWRAGIRLAETWTDVHVDKAFAAAASSNGVYSQGTSNYTVGAGPHFGIEINRKDVPTGLTFVARFDIADTFTRVRQDLQATTTTLYPNGTPQRGAFTQNFWSQVPILNYQVGLGWQPPGHPNSKYYIGYIYEFWWQFASNMNELNPYANQGGTRGNMSNQGIVLQGQWNW
jgi:hypothetical protein